MSYKALLDSNINKAFVLLRDLSQSATFVNKSLVSFNFANSTVNTSAASSVPFSLVVIERKKKDNTTTLVVLARFKDLGLIDSYDEITFEGAVWKLGSKLVESGRTVLFEMVKDG